MRSAILVVALFLLIACNNANQSAHVPASFKTDQLTAIMKSPQAVAKEVAKIVGENADNIKIYSENFATDVSQRTVLFSWPNGEEKIVKIAAGKELSINSYSSLGLGFIEKINEADFLKNFESKTSVQEKINQITNDETIDADLAIAEAKNLAQNAKLQQFEKMASVGETAYWETPVNALHVFANGISFTVTTNIENEKLAKEKAIELVQFIFSDPLKSSK